MNYTPLSVLPLQAEEEARGSVHLREGLNSERRAPGIEGLTVEFYKAYWEIVSADLLDVFNESLACGSMPMSCHRAVIMLLPKKGNLQDLMNWRPVSLLCVDYKLLSKAYRLREAMEQSIHRDQTYCARQVHGRQCLPDSGCLALAKSIGIYNGLIFRPGKGI